MSDPSIIEHSEKIGIGTLPRFGVQNMLDDVQTISADWFYTWMPDLQSGQAVGWNTGASASLSANGTDTELRLQGSGGWAEQNFLLSDAPTWSFAFEAQVLTGSGGVLLSFSDASGLEVATEWLPLTATDQKYSLTGNMPAGALSARVLAYTDASSVVQLDEFSFNTARGDIVLNGDFEMQPGTIPKPGFIPMIRDVRDMGKLGDLISAGAQGPLLTFNEPDESAQADMTVAQALSFWPDLIASGMRLGSPAVTAPETLKVNGWLEEFMDGAAARGYRVDFIAVHYYTTNPDTHAFRAFLDEVHIKYGRPIWVTEWSLADWANPGRFSAEEQEAFFKAGSLLLDDLDYVERHSWFSAYSDLDGWQLNTGLFDGAGMLTSLGQNFSELAADSTNTETMPELVANDDYSLVDEDQFLVDLYSLILSNDAGNRPGEELRIASIDTEGTLGSITFDSANLLLTYTADHDLFDTMPFGSTVADTFSYTLTDESGRAVRGSVTVNVAAVDDRMMLVGSRAPDSLTGGNGEDLLDGKTGNDVLCGMTGHDTLLGREGDDELNGASGRDFLVGGKGADNLFGGSDADYFAFGKHSGHDWILDFDAAADIIHLYEGVRVYSTTSVDRDGDGTKDILLRLKDGGSSHASVIVFGVEDLSDVTIEWFDSGTPASNFATTPGSAFFSDVSAALTETYGDFSGLDAMKWSFENVASFA